MRRDQARRIAEGARADHGVPDDADLDLVERRYIELVGADPEEPGPVRDVLVWIVKFVFDQDSRWVEFAVDEDTEEIVRVRRSR